MFEQRPDPDFLLGQINAKNMEQQMGKLKIYFGYAAGVGKTYAMLQAAHAAKQAGVDVVVGYIEPHTRPQTLALLEGLEQIPPKRLPYKSILLNEFDLDAALVRHPQLILVDELAHTNAQDCRHTKRYKDIEELLKAGIDVYTTVNVQHIESLNDIVASITGITVQERIPDSVFDNADQVELMDIEPEDLIERIHQGKVYREVQAKQALNHFFNNKNLVALREIALRRTADRVNRISEKNKQIDPQTDGYYTGEHILICLSPSPSNAKVIRTAARMANAFHAQFTALFVETSDFGDLTSKNRDRLRENLKLAQQLGAKIATMQGDDIAYQIAEYAKLAAVSKVVLGRTNTKRRLFFQKYTFSEQLIEHAPNLDVYIIPDKVAPAYRKEKPRLSRRGKVFSIADTLITLAFLVGATLIGLGFQMLGFTESNIIMVYILSVFLTAICTKSRIYSLALSLVSVLTFNYFFTVPRYTLLAYDAGYPVTFLIMFVVAFLTSSLALQLMRQVKLSTGKAYRTQILLETSQKLQQAQGKDEIISETAVQLLRLLGRLVIFYDTDHGQLTKPKPFLPEGWQQDINPFIANDEQAVAQWVFQNNRHAGATTGTLPGAKCLYLAVRNKEQALAVVGIAMNEGELETYESNLLLAIVNECALALEKAQLNETTNEMIITTQKEQLRANLLRSISHDLRTPLTSISGNAGILIGNGETLNSEKRQQLYTDIYDDSMWLINLVENLLSITRLEDGSMQLSMQAELLDEVIAEALKHIDRKSAEHHITVEQQDDLMLAKMDSRLIMQVIINIVDNAIKYTPVGSHIAISVEKHGEYVAVAIADDGQGVPDEVKDKLFDMFYTAKNGGVSDSRRGLGLGLALCKSIVLAHGGQITVADNSPQGTVFRFTLLAEEVVLHE